jgi:hypothetical protein
MGHLNLGNILFMFHHLHGTFKFREFGAAASNMQILLLEMTNLPSFLIITTDIALMEKN